MTPQQQAVLHQVKHLLSEHFDGVVLLVESGTDEGKDMEGEYWWHGGSCRAYGLLTWAKDKARGAMDENTVRKE